MIKTVELQNAGNTFVIAMGDESTLSKNRIIDLCKKDTKKPLDGLTLINQESENEYRLQYFNNDGSNFKMCFNGSLCAAYYISRKLKKTNFELFNSYLGKLGITCVGQHVHLGFKVPHVSVKSSLIDFLNTKALCNFVEIADNHKVIITDYQFDSHVEFMEIAQGLRRPDKVFLNGSNVHFIRKVETDIFIRHYEKAIEKETLSCGSGCVATAMIFPEDQELTFVSPGGTLKLLRIAIDTWCLIGAPKPISKA